MKLRRWFAALMIAGLALSMGISTGGQREIKTYTLFAGNTDSTEQASAWIPIYKAQRVLIRTYSGKAAFHASTDADSTYSDSIATWRTLFSDSICCTVNSLPSAADSVMITGWGIDSTKHVGVLGVGVNKQLRAPANGSGVFTVVYPTAVAGVVSPATGNEVFTTKYMRLRLTPLRRMTVTGSQSTAGIRVNGLRLLKVTAHVEFD